MRHAALAHGASDPAGQLLSGDRLPESVDKVLSALLALPPTVIAARYLGYICKVAVEEFFSERKLRLMLECYSKPVI